MIAVRLPYSAISRAVELAISKAELSVQSRKFRLSGTDRPYAMSLERLKELAHRAGSSNDGQIVLTRDDFQELKSALPGKFAQCQLGSASVEILSL